MGTRLFNLAAIASAVVCCLILTAAAVALAKDTYLPFMSVTRNFHLTVYPQGTRTHLLVCNDVEYGPYCGSITVGIAGNPNNPKVSGFDGLPGVYYQHIRWPDQTIRWGVRLHLAYLIGLTVLLPLAWWLRRVIRRRQLERRGFPVASETAAG